MNQAVHIDMEVLQRIKFLMEYDVTKTSSENVLVEQIEASKVPNLIRGTSTSTVSDYMPSWGKFSPTSLEDRWYLNVAKPDPSKTGTIKQGGLGIYAAAPSKEVREMRLDDFTEKVRSFMTNWGTMTVETVLTVTGIAIPVVILANGLWLTLEVAQLLKGTPDYLNLVFSFIATTTAGLGSATLRPLYSALAESLSKGGSGARSSVWKVLDQLYETARKLGLWDKVEPIFRKVSSMASTFGDFAVRTWTWLKENVLWIFQGVTWAGRVTINGLKSKISTFFTIIDTWLAGIAKKAGVPPEVAQKLGSAARWGSLPYAGKKASELLSKPDKMPGYEYTPGTFVPQDSTQPYVPAPMRVPGKYN